MDIAGIFTSLADNAAYQKLVVTAVTLILVVAAAKLLNGILYRTVKESARYYKAKKRVYYVTTTLYLMFLIALWSDSARTLATYLGFLSAGVAIALKDVLVNIAAWFFIVIRRPFGVGDRVEIAGHIGDVIDFRLFQFTLLEVSGTPEGEQSTGRITHVPNEFVFLHPLINYNRGFKYVWNEIKVLLTFESDWETAKGLFLSIAEKHSLHLTDAASAMIKEAGRRYMIHYKNLTPIVYTNVKESGIELSLRYLCAPKKKRDTIAKIWEDILKALEENPAIQLAYPTVRIYQMQGKQEENT